MHRIIKTLFVIWVATWTATTHKVKQCDLPVDPYTMENGNSDQIFGQVCTEDVKKVYKRRFATEQHAKEFIKECPEGVCSDWILDEIHD